MPATTESARALFKDKISSAFAGLIISVSVPGKFPSIESLSSSMLFLLFSFTPSPLVLTTKNISACFGVRLKTTAIVFSFPTNRPIIFLKQSITLSSLSITQRFTRKTLMLAAYPISLLLFNSLSKLTTSVFSLLKSVRYARSREYAIFPIFSNKIFSSIFKLSSIVISPQYYCIFIIITQINPNYYT